MIGRCFTLWAIAAHAAVPALPAQTAVSERVDAVFAEFTREGSPGCVVGALRDGGVLYAKGYGLANLELGERLTPSSVFYLASVSKQFTAASVALLALRGDLSLDDDVRHHVPELPAYDRPITIRHLVHHTSGLRDYLELMGLAGLSLEAAHTPDTILRLVARQQRANFPAGEQYLYSNTGYFLIPIIVERVTGQSFRTWTDANLLRPLGMQNSHFHDDWTHAVPNRALAYRRSDDGGFELDFLTHFDQVGSGGLLSTVADLARWDRNFFHPEVGGRAFVELQQARGVLTSGDTLSYAFGLDLEEYKKVRTVEHGGSMMGFRTYFLRFPDERFTVVCLCNLADANPSALAHRVADIYLADRFQQELAEYAGRYDSPELGVTWTVRVHEGALVARGPRDEDLALRPSTRDRFRSPRGADLRFVRDDAGRLTGFELSTGRSRGIRFDRADG